MWQLGKRLDGPSSGNPAKSLRWKFEVPRPRRWDRTTFVLTKPMMPPCWYRRHRQYRHKNTFAIARETANDTRNRQCRKMPIERGFVDQFEDTPLDVTTWRKQGVAQLARAVIVELRASEICSGFRASLNLIQQRTCWSSTVFSF